MLNLSSTALFVFWFRKDDLMDAYKIRAISLKEGQSYEYVRKSILAAIKEENLTLSQVVGIFAEIVDEICTKNSINDLH